jgi:excisionase family DNA binding protein
METTKTLSVAEASEALGVSMRTVRRWCEDKKLRAFRHGKAHQIAPESVEKMKLALAQERAGPDTAAGPVEPELPAREDEPPDVDADTPAGQTSVPVAEAGAPVQVRVLIGEPRTEYGQGAAEPEQERESAADELAQLRADVQELRTRLAQETSTQQARSARADKTAADWWAWVQSEVARLGQESSAQQARSAHAAQWWVWIQTELTARTHGARVLQVAAGVLAAVAVVCVLTLYAGKMRLDEDRDRLAFLAAELAQERTERAALEFRLVGVEARAQATAQEAAFLRRVLQADLVDPQKAARWNQVIREGLARGQAESFSGPGGSDARAGIARLVRGLSTGLQP